MSLSVKDARPRRHTLITKLQHLGHKLTGALCALQAGLREMVPISELIPETHPELLAHVADRRKVRTTMSGSDAASVTSAAVLRRRIAKFNLTVPPGDYLKEENSAHPPK
jgi:hypothetical protein